MAPTKTKDPLPLAKDHAVLAARIDAAIARQESLVSSWMTRFGRPAVTKKSQAELDAEDAELYRLEPPRLGLGAPIPKEFLDASDGKRTELGTNERLRRIMLGRNAAAAAAGKGHTVGKPRDVQAQGQAQGQMKRARKDESSDEEEGRTGVGRAKKAKSIRETPAVHPAVAAAAAAAAAKSSSSSSPAKSQGTPTKSSPAKTQAAPVSPAKSPSKPAVVSSPSQATQPKQNIPLQRPSKKSAQLTPTDNESEDDDETDIMNAVPTKATLTGHQDVDEEEAARLRREAKKQRKKERRMKKKAERQR